MEKRTHVYIGDGLFLLAVLFILSACSAYNSGANKQAANKSAETTVVQSEEVLAQPEQPEDLEGTENLSSIKKGKPGPFAKNPQVMEMYRSVLQDGAAFYNTFYQEEMTMEQFTKSCNGGDQSGAEVSEFTIVDLDCDGQTEVILKLLNSNDDPFVYEILRCQDDIVYGYSLPYRCFQQLKSDGSFYFSSGIVDNGFGTIQFDADIYTITKVAYSQSNYDEFNNFSISFFVDGKNVSERVYYDKLAELCHTKAWWYSFTEERLNQIFTT